MVMAQVLANVVETADAQRGMLAHEPCTCVDVECYFLSDNAERMLRKEEKALDAPASVSVIEVRHTLATDFDDPDLWDRWMALFREHWPLDEGPHAVFSSDGYVSELAGRFGAEAVVVDAERVAVPISATQIRTSPGDHLDRLAPQVRAWVESNWL